MILEGLVVQSTGSHYRVRVDGTFYTCKIKGAFKLKEISTTNPIAIGDWVEIEIDEPRQPDDLAWIRKIFPRKNYILRRSSNLSKQAHILGANLDRVLLICTVNYPVTSTTFIDRFLATAEAYGVEVGIAFNKIDRYNRREMNTLDRLMHLYRKIGYPCFALSAETGEGMEEVRRHIDHGITLISGHSGVGKSTFINKLFPDMHLKTGAISEAHNAGVHTTTYSTMIEIPSPTSEVPRGYLIDTPGIKGFGTIEFDPVEVGHYFREIFKLSEGCRFGNCTHTHEPGCAVLRALRTGELSESRYKSYLSILYEKEGEKYRPPQ